MRRISVVGTSGSGKSTVARNIARRLVIRYADRDASHLQFLDARVGAAAD
ncbi:hypothetical protein AB0H58_32045 [Nocardia neocaledoniensis]